MTKNTQMELNNVLFEQLEKLSDNEHMAENYDMEIARSKQVAAVGNSIINNFRLALEIEKMKAEYGLIDNGVPKMLQND